MHPNYTIILQHDAIDNIFIAMVPELPGCATHGATYEEALRQAHDAIETWLLNDDPATYPVPVEYPQPVVVTQ